MSTSHDLFATIAAGDETRLTALLAQQPELANTRSSEGISPVLWAYYTGKTKLVPTLLATNPLLDIYDSAALGDSDRVRELLTKDASLVQAFSSDGFTALHYIAFFNGSTDTATTLLDAGAEVDIVAHNRQQVTPLHSAAAGRNDIMVHFLVEHGADVNTRQEGGMTPLMEVAQNGDAALIDYLLAQGADLTLKADTGQTAADYARESGHTALAAILSSK